MAKGSDREIPRGVPTVRPDEAARERRRLEEEEATPPEDSPRWWRTEATDPDDPFAGMAGASVSQVDEGRARPARRVLPGPGIRGKG